MIRVTIGIIALAIAVTAVFLYERSSSCRGSFQISYTPLLSLITTKQNDRESERQCELLVERLVDFDVVVDKLALSKGHLQSRLDIEAIVSNWPRTDCKITFRGRDGSETLNVLHVLIDELANSSAQLALEEQAQTINFVKTYLAEITERRTIAASLDEEHSNGDKNWIVPGDVENWTLTKLEKVTEKLNTILATEYQKPTETSCVEYLQQADEYTSEKMRKLEVRCRESKPVGIAEWPRLSSGCYSKHVKPRDSQQSRLGPVDITPSKAYQRTLNTPENGHGRFSLF